MNGSVETGGHAAPPEIRAALGGFDPTPEQWRAISMPLEPYVIVAGAGSGKTSVIAARVVYLALVALGRLQAPHEGVLPGSVLCLTFTNKATENLQLRIRRALSAVELPEGEEPTILNYHGFAAQVLDRHGLRVGIEPGQRVLTSAQRVELCARVLDEMTFDHVTSTWQPTLVENILSLVDQAANHRVVPGEIVAFNETRLADVETPENRTYQQQPRVREAILQRIELARAAALFRRLKRELGVIDFGDQITLALQIVERFPEVGAEYRQRYDAVVLDEYQDTNVAQAHLIQRVFGDGFPVTAVGDPDQNIYAWRGASLFNLIAFRGEFRRRDGSEADKLPLYTNFRSGAHILAAADRIVRDLPPGQRPDPDKKLVPWAANGDGEVEVRRFGDEQAEADAIADRILGMHEEGAGPWSESAVLCRKSRLFVPIQRAFAERGIPVEIIGLAGLLKLPEVVEVLAYVRAVADPYAGVSLARILLGPRYRVGFKDLARVAAWAKEKNYDLRDRGRDLRGEEEEETPPFLFAEALEHLDDVTYLSDEGRVRLEEFRRELAGLRAEARRPVGEFLAEIVRRIGLLTELDASLATQQALATRRNLAAFLDEVHGFTPLEGELTIRAFLDYLEAVEATDSPEWSPVQPSEDDSVKVMTIHQVKGLEFDAVFVPGMAKDILPDFRVQQNPAEKGRSLDFELRGDRDILPSFQGNLRQFWYALRDQALVEERRTCYVALTRARKRLFVSGAHWYGDDTGKPKDDSVFFEELAAWGEESGSATVDRGPDVSEENPLVKYRERFVRVWPGQALRAEADELFPEGWRGAAVEAATAGAAGVRASAREVALSPEDLERYEAAAAERGTLALHLAEREAAGPVRPSAPSSVSVSGLIDYSGCPKRFYWTTVRPLPRFSGPAARIGTQVHAWIERQGSGQASLLELEESPDLTAEELTGEPGKVDRLQHSFLESRFGSAVPLFAERPFLLFLGGFVVNGRIDAIFGTPDGPWEVVDYKTGKRPASDDPVAGLQLDLYALACTEVFGKRPEELRLTYFYLANGEEVSRGAGDPSETRARVLAALEGIGAGSFDPTPGDQCRWCDFLGFCSAGRAHLGKPEANEGGAR
jgi:DNA helicase-2/ATP-dependent DNA helicase PcrA